MLKRVLENSREIVLLLTTLLGALILEQLFSLASGGHFSFSVFGAVCALTVLASSVAVIIYTWLAERPLKIRLDRVALRVPEVILTLDQTKEIERSAKQIWIVTNDFFWDVSSGYFDEVVLPNIRKRKTYKYFYPKGARSLEASALIKQRLGDARGVDFVFVDPEVFGTILFEFALFDPTNDKAVRGIVSDVFGTRFSRPEECLDMLLDQKQVLPRFVSLASRWAMQYRDESAAGHST